MKRKKGGKEGRKKRVEVEFFSSLARFLALVSSFSSLHRFFAISFQLSARLARWRLIILGPQARSLARRRSSSSSVSSFSSSSAGSRGRRVDSEASGATERRYGVLVSALPRR